MPSSAKSWGVGSNKKGVWPKTAHSASTLLSRVSHLTSLRSAFRKVARNRSSSGGVDEVTIAEFDAHAEKYLRVIGADLRNGTYNFSKLRPVAIPKRDGKSYRPILIPTVADRVVQRAILGHLAPHLEGHVATANSHAFRNDAGVRSAIYQLRDEIRGGKRFVLIVDIVDFFSSIPAERLFTELQAALPDASLGGLLMQLRDWEINDLTHIPTFKRGCFPQAGKGVPQGSALSPILSNFYLRSLDLEGSSSPVRTIRYADDIAIASSTYEEAVESYDWLRARIEAMQLTIHPLGSNKSRIVALGEKAAGIDYLGCFMRVATTGVSIRPSKGSVDNALRTVEEVLSEGSPLTLSERYRHLSFFLNAWFGTYGFICGSIKREQRKLLELTEQELFRLLRDKGLLPAAGGLTVTQRRFLGVNSLFQPRDGAGRRAGGHRGKHSAH